MSTITLLTVLIVIASIVLILVVLVQKSKGGGLASNFSSSNAIMGVRKTTDFVEKATWGLAGFIIILSVVSVVIRPKVKATGTVIQTQQPQQDETVTFPSSAPFPGTNNTPTEENNQ